MFEGSGKSFIPTAQVCLILINFSALQCHALYIARQKSDSRLVTDSLEIAGKFVRTRRN